MREGRQGWGGGSEQGWRGTGASEQLAVPSLGWGLAGSSEVQLVAPLCREGILPHQAQWPCWLSQLSWLKATLTATGLATPMATNQCPAGQKQQSLHTLGERGQGGSLPPASLAVGIRGWKEHLAMSPAPLQALAWGGESQQCHRVRKSPAWLGSLGSLVPTPLCPCTQHGTATPTQLRELEPTPACPSCCRARGHPPGTGTSPRHRPAPLASV